MGLRFGFCLGSGFELGFGFGLRFGLGLGCGLGLGFGLGWGWVRPAVGEAEEQAAERPHVHTQPDALAPVQV